jgi:hypothetical protein
MEAWKTAGLAMTKTVSSVRTLPCSVQSTPSTGLALDATNSKPKLRRESIEACSCGLLKEEVQETEFTRT